MYRMFVKERKKELIEAIGNAGGGFIPAEIMVCQDFELAVPDIEERQYWKEIKWPEAETPMLQVMQLSNGKLVFIQGKEITRDEAHEIIIHLTGTWGTDFEKQDLKDAALGLSRDC